MTERFLYTSAAALTLTLGGLAPAADRPPNIIFILADNAGYGDFGCYGSKRHRTPNMDRMAAEGLRFTSFYSACGVCTPSRASLMTGCYPRRVNMQSSASGESVLSPMDRKGLHPDEITIARSLKGYGYATMCIGKWHLGDQPPFLPTNHGFDHYFGIPYSDNQTPEVSQNWPPLPLMRDEKVIEAPVDRNTLTKRCTEEAIRFITENKDRPFFLYLPHAMPGSTTRPFASPAFHGKSKNGPYGDSIEEIDWSTGEILATLKNLDLDGKTLVVWTSDNGALYRSRGSNAPLKGWGYDTSEGAMRMPCVVRWPGTIPAGTVCDELSSMMDWLPTFAKLAGGEPPRDRIIDGHDIRPLLFGQPGAKSGYDETGFFYYLSGYKTDQLQAVRAGSWKLYLPLEKKIFRTRKPENVPAMLYDVRNDISETKEVSAQHPDIVARLTGLADQAREDLGDLGHPGKNQRPAGRVNNPKPQVLPAGSL